MDSIESLYVNYEGIVKQFGKEVIENRFNVFLEMMNNFIKQLNIDENKVNVNDYILMHSLLCYFSDVQRLKEFHDIERTNEYKITAYESYWILQRKPIQITAKDEKLIYLNEKFVVSYILSFLCKQCGLDITRINSAESSKKHFSSFNDSLFYFIKYRVLTAQMLEMFLLSFKTGNVCGFVSPN